MVKIDELRADREASQGIFFVPVSSMCENQIELANARRIARLPEIEAAFLEAVETLQNIASGWDDVPGYNRPDDAAQGSILQGIARTFLEKLK